MTRLYNRAFFNDFFVKQINSAATRESACSIILLNIDKFKFYNDKHGYQYGDKVIKKIAEILKVGTRKTDMVSRFRGKEFAIILPGTSIKMTESIAEKIRASIEKEKFEHQELQPNGNLTVSISLSTYPDNGNSSEDLLKHVENGMIRAKEMGGNTIVY